METVPWWASEDVWRKIAIWVTALMTVVLIVLTYDSLEAITAGGESNRVQAYSVINNRIYYRYNKDRGMSEPVIGEQAPLFGKVLTEKEAWALVDKGKITTQAKNCMGCHTFLGNGSYYAPDLTKSWLDPAWGSEAVREELMLRFLQDPESNARGYGSTRKMPNLDITEEEAHGIVAYLKWMSAIDTNGFPRNFPAISQEGDR
jgi:nitric oxide reductase subunit C